MAEGDYTTTSARPARPTCGRYPRLSRGCAASWSRRWKPAATRRPSRPARRPTLDTQAAELRRSNGELEQFAYVASHDLQEPLRKVASFCQLLEKRYSDKLDERGLKYIEFAVDGAKRMQVLINDLLTFSRVGRATDVRVPVPLGQPLDAAVTALSAAVEETGAVVERPGPLPEVMGDPTLLGMLWQNLIGNAIKFRAPDRAPVIQVTAAAQPDGNWQIGVADNGIGVPAEFADKIFVIFQRLHGRDAYPGTGIGLALCKRIVEQHGGQMYLDTTYEGGTRIYFSLPAAAAAVSAAPAGHPDVIVTFARPDPDPDGASHPGPGGAPEPGGESSSTIPGGTLHV